MTEEAMEEETTAAVTEPAPVQTKPTEKPAELNTEIQQKWAGILASKPGALEDLVQRVEALKGVDPRIHALEIKNAKSEAIIEHGLTKEDAALLGDISPEQVAENARILKERYAAIADAVKNTAVEPVAAKPTGVQLPQIDQERMKNDPMGALAAAAAAQWKDANK